MTQSLAARLFSMVLALAAGFGPGAQALAHGHAHEQMAAASLHGHDHPAPHALSAARGSEQHVDIAERSVRSGTPHGGLPPGAMTVGAAGADDHGHPQVGASLVSRGDLRLDLSSVALLAPPAAVLTLPPEHTVAARLLISAPPRAGPAPAPPLPARAPPLG